MKSCSVINTPKLISEFRYRKISFHVGISAERFPAMYQLHEGRVEDDALIQRQANSFQMRFKYSLIIPD